MKQIKQFIRGLSISPELQDELCADQLLQKHSFYLRLAPYLAPAFRPVSAESLHSLTGFGYLYFRFLLGIDSLLDGQVSAQEAAQRLFSSISIHEHSVRGLANLFIPTDSFWPAFEACKAEYISANLQEKKLSALRSQITEEKFEEMAAGKSAVCYAMVHALSSLSQDETPVAELRQCLRHLHIGLQYLDDVQDFQQDLATGQHTYAYAYLVQQLHRQEVAVDQLTTAGLHRYLYTSGAAEYLLQRGHHHYQTSLAIAQGLGLAQLGLYLELQAAKCRSYQQDIERLLLKTKIKAGKSFAPLHTQPAEVTVPNLHAAVHQALQHLRRSRDGQGCWTDFMTSAGQSKLWVTAYAGLQLAEVKEGVSTAHDAFDASAFLPASYNESIMQDGDSTNFNMGLSRKVWGTATSHQLQMWLSFMDADGGWVTYRHADQLRRRLKLPEHVEVTGWLTPKLCVTAAAAYVLSCYPDLNAQYATSCSYLLGQQHPDGYWTSYWWTSPIYATAFAVLALAPRPEYDRPRAAALRWLASQQTSTGAWSAAVDAQQPSAFFTALAVKALLTDPSETYALHLERAISWLLNEQTSDGSWQTSRILRIPATDVQDPDTVTKWRASSFGVNVVVDDHNRIFTTSTVLNALGKFARKLAETSSCHAHDHAS